MGRRIPNAVLWILLLGVCCAPVALLAHDDRGLIHRADIPWFAFAAAIVCVGIFVLLRLAENKPARCRHCGNPLNEDTPVCPSCGVGDRANEDALYDASTDNASGPLGLSRYEWVMYAVIAVLSLGLIKEILFDRQLRWTAVLLFIVVVLQIVRLCRHRKEQVAYQRYRKGRCVRCGRDRKDSATLTCPESALQSGAT